METQKQQQLESRNTYTPTNLQVCSSVVLSLNREETLSEQNLKTLSNNLDVNQRQHTVGQKISGIVYVISINGKTLMPSSSSKVRKLLRKGLAKVVRRNPFTIQLLVPCREETQEVVCKIDSGYKHIGFSCITKKQELISGEVELENKTSKRLIERKMYRRGRRNKLWYRQPRFNNRTRKVNWLPPSIRKETYKIQPHDLIWINRKVNNVSGMMNLGKTVLLSNKKTSNVKNIEKHFVVGSLYVTKLIGDSNGC